MDIPNDPPDDQLGPAELHDRVEATVNLDVEELEAFQDSQFNESYLEQASEAAQPGDEPLEDTIRLLETPRYQYEDVDPNAGADREPGAWPKLSDRGGGHAEARRRVDTLGHRPGRGA